MEYLSVRELRNSSKHVWERLSVNGEIVITNNGKPTALMLHISDGDYEELARAIRQAKAMRALNAIRSEASERGFLTEQEVAEEIKAYRKEKRGKI